MVLYISALPVAATHPGWMGNWKGTWTTGGTLAFMAVRGQERSGEGKQQRRQPQRD
jgi:hypothetical protein